MKNILLILLAIFTLTSCEKDVTDGFLETENAVYSPDVVTIRKTLDKENEWSPDYHRFNNQSPWVSPKIQGVIGTTVIVYAIEDVTSEDGDAAKMKAALTIKGGGTMYVPLENDVPVGTYVISITISNDGRSFIKKNMFTFIVE